jgi:hypothetical protein
VNKAAVCAKFTWLFRDVFDANELTTAAAATTHDVADWAGMRSRG